MHGAVSRLHGSPTIAAAGSSGNCFRTASTSRRFVTTICRSCGTISPSRSSVCRIIVSSPTSCSSCFGESLRLAGQNRVPVPPAMMIA